MANYGLRGVARVTLFDLLTGLPELYSNYAQASSQEWSSEQTFAHASGSRSIRWDSNREGTLTLSMEIFDLKMLAIIAGSDVTTGSTEVMRREVFKMEPGDGSQVQLSRNAVEGSVSVVPVSPLNNVTFIGEPLQSVDSGSVVGEGEFQIDGDTITFADDVAGQTFAVFYASVVTSARTITINADRFPKAYRITGDAFVRNQSTGADEWMALEVFNARPISNFEVTMSADDVTTLEVTFDMFPDALTGDMMSYKVIDGDVPSHHPDFGNQGN